MIYPTPHFEKLKATLRNKKLPMEDKPHIEQAIKDYEKWIADMDIIIDGQSQTDKRLQEMVELLNQYRIRLDIDLIFNSQNDWLYRQKGQIKLDNSIIEEFLPRLVNSSLSDELSQANISIGPIETFSAVWFDSSLAGPQAGGGLSIRKKDQDFALSRPLYLQASHSADFQHSVLAVTNLAYVVAECKTNLDKTMFQEAIATAHALKTTIPSAKYFLLCEWLDMTPVNTATTSIDRVLILRKARRISSNIREVFSTYQGRKEAKSTYLDFLIKNPYRVEVFQIFLDSINQLLRSDILDEQTVLERGYF